MGKRRNAMRKMMQLAAVALAIGVVGSGASPRT